MNKLTSTILIFSFLLLANSAQAMELGQIRLLSHLNEPLQAEISLGEVAESDLADLHFSLADQDVYHSMGLDKPFNLGELRFRLVAGEGRQHFVRVSTRQRIREPILSLFIRLEGMQGSLSRLYTLMLDPRVLSTVARTAPVNSVRIARQVVDTANADTKLTEDRSAATPESLRVGNQSLSIIAQNSPLHEKYSVYQIMRAFYLLNQQAFIKGNINHLQAGSLLSIPAEALVAEIPRQQAINFVYAKSKDQSGFNQAQSAPQARRKAADKSVQQADSAAVSVKAKPSIAPARASTSSVSLDGSIQKDIQDWRNMIHEFSQLSGIVQSQNNVLKIHGEALKQMDTRMAQGVSQLQQLQHRIQELEAGAAGQRPQSTVSSLSPGTETGEPVLNNTDIRNLIRQVSQRLQRLEQQLKPTLAVKPTLAASASVTVAQDQISSSNPQMEVTVQKFFVAGKQWVMPLLVAVMVFLLLVIREIGWRRKIRQLEALPVETQHADMGAVNPEVDLDAATESVDQVETDVDDKLGQTIESDLQIAEKKYEESVAQAREYTFDSTVTKTHQQASQPDDEALYAEIDILIAYQLYDEALKMVKTAREKNNESHCLDIRELEILAYIKEEDLFLQKYEAQKESLSAEFPEAWAKIESLYREMDAAYPRIVTL